MRTFPACVVVVAVTVMSTPTTTVTAADTPATKTCALPSKAQVDMMKARHFDVPREEACTNGGEINSMCVFECAASYTLTAAETGTARRRRRRRLLRAVDTDATSAGNCSADTPEQCTAGTWVCAPTSPATIAAAAGDASPPAPFTYQGATGDDAAECVPETEVKADVTTCVVPGARDPNKCIQGASDDGTGPQCLQSSCVSAPSTGSFLQFVCVDDVVHARRCINAKTCATASTSCSAPMTLGEFDDSDELADAMTCAMISCPKSSPLRRCRDYDCPSVRNNLLNDKSKVNVVCDGVCVPGECCKTDYSKKSKTVSPPGPNHSTAIILVFLGIAVVAAIACFAWRYKSTQTQIQQKQMLLAEYGEAAPGALASKESVDE